MEWEEVLTVHVAIIDTVSLHNDSGDSVVMISFTGHATGKYFEGIILDGGVDTQIIGSSGERHSLSARYMLRGKDYTGQPCEIYIENNGNMNKELKSAAFRTTPKIITNSKALSFLNQDLLIGEGLPAEAGVDIRIYRAI
ncbi:DUF3237 family protein [Saccharibacillus kuerlensis]|uniref:DUF3237 domain-containing protein n=1 Tax=Saccharibacillus kuerlensis TaxID=459527 RepID=A0ABQ2KVQ0_9BACL|nr:DUF3237 family protein [Saccharibacillus kuerlensis]GGN94803.1 hypothetical protein GCM10010969_09870 [Saccharibacillus kuerlensis]